MHPKYESPVLAMAVGVGAVLVGLASSLGRCGIGLPGAAPRIVRATTGRIVVASDGARCVAVGVDATFVWLGVAAVVLGLAGAVSRAIVG